MKRLASVTVLVFVLVFVLAAAPVLAQGEDLFNAVALDNGDLFIQHLNSYHNCCVPIAHEVDIQGFRIAVTEIEPYLNGCWCLCWFDVDLVIHDLPPGTYTVSYSWDSDANLYTEVWHTVELTVEKPLPNLLPVEPTSDTFLSECHDGTSVATEGVAFDRLKSWYR